MASRSTVLTVLVVFICLSSACIDVWQMCVNDCRRDGESRSMCEVGCRIDKMQCNRKTLRDEAEANGEYKLVAYPGMMPYMKESEGDIFIPIPDGARDLLGATQRDGDKKGDIVAKLTSNNTVLWKQYVNVDIPDWVNKHGLKHWVAPFRFEQLHEQQPSMYGHYEQSEVHQLTVSLHDCMSDNEVMATDVIVVRAPYRQAAVVLDNRNGQIQVDQVGFFPIGMYTSGVTSNVDMSIPDDEIIHGFNIIGPYLSEAGGHNNNTWSDIDSFLHRCDLIGMKVHYDLAALAEQANSSKKWELLKEEVNRVKSHPSIFAYYLADEPGGAHIPVSTLVEVYKFVKQLDPYHPITTVFCCVDPSVYASAYDIGMKDPYPIPNQPITAVSDAARTLRKVGKPFFIVPQAFGGGEWWERNPSRQEERVMTYLAVINGAVGIQYFIRVPEQFPYSPAAWSECRQVTLEIVDIAESILTNKSSVEVDVKTVEVAGWNGRLPGMVTLAAANTQNVPVQVNLVALENITYNGPVDVIGQNRQVLAVNGRVSDTIPALGTAIYRFPPTQSPNANVKGPQPLANNILRNPSFEESFNIGSPDGAYIRAGSDRAATYFTDSFQSVHGLHSLRLITPTNTTGPGVSVAPYPVKFLQHVTYKFSVWVKAALMNSQLRVDFSQAFQPNDNFTFGVNTDWTELTSTVTATRDQQPRESPLRYQSISPGTMWLDLIQLIPIKNGTRRKSKI